MSFTAIIPTRNEPHLKWTVDNLRRTANPKEIVIVYDGLQKVEEIDGALNVRTPWTTAQGVGKCRDWGVQFANTEYIVFLDGHMDFALDWSEILLDTVDTFKDSVCCSKSAYIDRQGMKSTQRVNCGAYIRYIGGGTGMPLEVEWGEPLKPGRIQCCLGACYGMKTQRYFDIGEPCKSAFGWGTSEQTLCMVNEMCGGVNVLADCTTGHIYRDNSEIPYEFGQDLKIGRMFNRLRLINMMPMEDKERVDLLNKAMSFRPLRIYAERALALLQDTDDWHIIKRYKRSWKEYTERWWPKSDDKVRKIPQDTRPQISHRHEPKDRRFI